MQLKSNLALEKNMIRKMEDLIEVLGFQAMAENAEANRYDGSSTGINHAVKFTTRELFIKVR